MSLINRLGIKLGADFSEASAMNPVIFLDTVIRQRLAMNLSSRQAGSIGKDCGHQHIDSTFFLQGVKTLINTFIDEGAMRRFALRQTFYSLRLMKLLKSEQHYLCWMSGWA